MKVISIPCILFVTIGLAAQDKATISETVIVSPIPPLPSDAMVPDATSKHHVFIDPRTSDLVIMYADNGIAITKRVPTHSHVDPFFNLSISQDESGKNIYSYALRNSSRAQDGIVSWTIPAPVETNGQADSESSHISITNIPSFWETNEVASVSGERRLLWSTRSLSAGVGAGKEITNFSFRSGLKPGFVEAHVFGSSGLFASEFPEEIAAELKRIELFHMDSKTALILAPKFASDASSIEIASDYYRGVRILIDNGYLSSDSSFIADTLAALRGYLVSVSGEMDISPANYPVPNLTVIHPPTTDLEREIFQSMKVALDANIQ